MCSTDFVDYFLRPSQAERESEKEQIVYYLCHAKNDHMGYCQLVHQV